MGSGDPATWAEVIRAASPILGALIALAGVIVSLRHSSRRDDARMKHERELKDKELEAVRDDRLREERKRIYAQLVATTSTIRMEESHRVEDIVRVSEALSEIELVSGSEEVKKAALALHDHHSVAVEMGAQERNAGKDPNQDTGFQNAVVAVKDAMSTFLDAAREELDVRPRTPHAGDRTPPR